MPLSIRSRLAEVAGELRRLRSQAKQCFDCLFYPATCILCERYHESAQPWVCDACAHALLQEQVAGFAFPNLPDFPGLRVFSGWHYTKAVQKIIHSLKYEKHFSLGPWLGRALAERAAGSGAFSGNEILIPVPLHHRRLRERGFNQSDKIANGIQQKFPGCRVVECLQRVIHTAPQATLPREERLLNARDAFAMKSSSDLGLAGRTALLIDDVRTTGATLSACARALAQHEVNAVAAMTFASAS